MIERENPQTVQESFYEFPYHYVAQFQPGFRQHFYDSWGINYVSTIELVIDQLRRREWRRLVDIGCGDGRLVFELAKAFPGRVVRGIDYSARAIALAEAMNPALDFQCRDICAEPLSGEYDTAVLMEVYEHIPPERAGTFVRAVSAALEPGGSVLVTVPHLNKPLEPHHYRHFDGGLLAREWSTAFQAVEVHPFERRSRWQAIVRSLLANRLFILNHGRLRNAVYRFYKDFLFSVSSERDCQRLLLTARK